MTAWRGWFTGQMLPVGRSAVPAWKQEQNPRPSLCQVSSFILWILGNAFYFTVIGLFDPGFSCFYLKGKVKLF